MTCVARRGRTAGPELQDWLGAREPALQRTAHLLTGDVDRAQPLVVDTLARLDLAWGRVRRSDDLDNEARRLLVRAFRTASPRDGAADARTVLVLRLHDHLTDPEIADLMRTSVSSVRSVTVSDEPALARSFFDETDDVEYPVTPLAAVARRADEIRGARRRTTTKVASVVLAAGVVVSAVTLIGRGDGTDETLAPVAPLSQLRLGAAPEVGYLDGNTFVSRSGDRFTSPTFHRAQTVAEYDDGVFVAGPVSSRRPFPTISRIIHASTVHVGCGTPAFVLGAAGADPTYWLSDS